MKDDYVLHTIDYIVQNKKEIVKQCDFIKTLYEENLTENYHRYNLFSITSGSVYFHQIYKCFRNFIFDNLPDRRIWFQSWLNYHKEDEVLDWHTHAWDYHGYISIDPKDTTTEFDEYEIDNKVGQIYFGRGYRNHRVNVKTSYPGPRITIGFDITEDAMMGTGCFGLFPLI